MANFYLRFDRCACILFLACLPFFVQGQHKQFISIEGSAGFIGSRYQDLNYIRLSQSPESTQNGRSPQAVHSEMYRLFAGVRIEQRTLNQKLGFSIGLRYVNEQTAVAKNGFLEYFYVQSQTSGTRTDYLKVSRINQHSSYISVPVELRYYPWDVKFRTYFSAGAEVNGRIHTKNTTTFQNAAMGMYEDEVSALVGKPRTWHGTFYLGIGWIAGSETKNRFAFGLSVPVMIGAGTSTLAKPVVGIAVNLQIQIPQMKPTLTKPK